LGINLNSQGELTYHQAEQADSLGIPHEKYKQIIIDRLIEIHGGKTPETNRIDSMKRDSITAKTPVLILGAGSSLKDNYEAVKKFEHTIVCLDYAFNSVVENGIIPDYILTLEQTKQVMNPSVYKPENLAQCGVKTKVICSSITRDVIKDHLTANGVTHENWITDEEPRMSNVGLFAINYCHTVLKADKILLVGFEHVGQKYPQHIYQVWQTDFWYFIRKWDKETIVNCSDGGALYYEDYIIDSTLDKLKIER